jgi:hypothetical protein
MYLFRVYSVGAPAASASAASSGCMATLLGNVSSPAWTGVLRIDKSSANPIPGDFSRAKERMESRDENGSFLLTALT